MPGRRNVMIVLAAGQGKRMNRPYPKMLIPLRGKPLLHWTLRSLDRCPSVDAVIVAVPAEWRAEFEKKIPFRKYKKFSMLVNGGRERTDSTRSAIAALPAECELVGIHDGARPFASSASIGRCFSAAKRSGAAILAAPATDTMKIASKSLTVVETVPRERCWSAQTPQIFRRKIAEKMHASRRSARFTDDASIAESLGYRVAIVPGSHDNIKVTTPKDLLTAEKMLGRKS